MNLPDKKNRAYSVIDYDPRWAKLFNAEAITLKNILGDYALSVEHVGSSAVSGMDSKPIIDILVIVDDVTLAESFKEKMGEYGYVYAGQVVGERSRLYRKMNRDIITANIHIFPEGHPHIKEMITLREFLRSHPNEALKYSQVKKEIFIKYPTDYMEYKKLKDIYIQNLMKRIGS
jgi:GrpB-like predicted nucleotidyltransferase (UPF0157 family)